MSKTKNFRENVAEEMIRHLEAGTAPWQKPWEPGVYHARPFNPTTNKPYHGINSVILDMSEHEDPRWMTFRQAKDLDAQVKGGEEATKIEYWRWTDTRKVLDDHGKPVTGADGKPKTETVKLDRPQVFYASVFNAEQIDGLEPYKAPPLQFDPVEQAEALLKQTGVEILHDQDDRAFYATRQDKIHLPHKAAFSTAYDYYATALHEVGHATGHKSRMNREFGPFGSEAYAKEELKAEISSYLVSRESGLGHNPERHAGYLDSGNLKTVAEVVRGQYPKAKMVIAADNDHQLKNNIGLIKAEEAAKAVGGSVIEPKFTKEEGLKGLTDWNDLAQSRGKTETTKVIKAALRSQSRKKGQSKEMAVA